MSELEITQLFVQLTLFSSILGFFLALLIEFFNHRGF